MQYPEKLEKRFFYESGVILILNIIAVYFILMCGYRYAVSLKFI